MHTDTAALSFPACPQFASTENTSDIHLNLQRIYRKRNKLFPVLFLLKRSLVFISAFLISSREVIVSFTPHLTVQSPSVWPTAHQTNEWEEESLQIALMWEGHLGEGFRRASGFTRLGFKTEPSLPTAFDLNEDWATERAWRCEVQQPFSSVFEPVARLHFAWGCI